MSQDCPGQKSNMRSDKRYVRYIKSDVRGPLYAPDRPEGESNRRR
jgi:hypothetical protein